MKRFFADGISAEMVENGAGEMAVKLVVRGREELLRSRTEVGRVAAVYRNVAEWLSRDAMPRIDA